VAFDEDPVGFWAGDPAIKIGVTVNASKLRLGCLVQLLALPDRSEVVM